MEPLLEGDAGRSMATRVTHTRRVLAGATAWGALWVFGILVVLAPSLPAGVDPRGVLWGGAIGFVAGLVLNGALVCVWRNRDLAEIGVGGLGLISRHKALGGAHVLGTTWIAFRLVFAQDGGSFFFEFPGVVEVFALLTALFALPIWAFVAAVIKLTTNAKSHVLFLLADVVTIPVVFLLFLNASKGIG